MIEIQGHRGCRGILPENTIEGFIHTLKMGVQTIELDVVVSKDSQIIVSHEPWFNHNISSHPDNIEITADNERQFNLFNMSAAEIQRFDVGLKFHEKFPDQQKVKALKPTLREVVYSIRDTFGEENSKSFHYNIEIKFDPGLAGTFFPDPEIFADLLIEEVKELKIDKQCNIQSFNSECLNIVRKKVPEIPIALLVDNHLGFKRNLDFLEFQPEIYSPHFKLVDKDLITNCHKKGIKLIVWTVNERNDLEQMASMDIDGIITDFPDRALDVLKAVSKVHSH